MTPGKVWRASRPYIVDTCGVHHIVRRGRAHTWCGLHAAPSRIAHKSNVALSNTCNQCKRSAAGHQRLVRAGQA